MFKPDPHSIITGIAAALALFKEVRRCYRNWRQRRKPHNPKRQS